MLPRVSVRVPVYCYSDRVKTIDTSFFFQLAQDSTLRIFTIFNEATWET